MVTGVVLGEILTLPHGCLIMFLGDMFDLYVSGFLLSQLER